MTVRAADVVTILVNMGKTVLVTILVAVLKARVVPVGRASQCCAIGIRGRVPRIVRGTRETRVAKLPLVAGVATRVAVRIEVGSTSSQARWRRQAWGGGPSVSKAIDGPVGDAVDVGHLHSRGLRGDLTRSDSQWILGEAQANTTLDTVVQGLTVELVESLGGKRNVLKLDKAHGAILLGPET